MKGPEDPVGGRGELILIADEDPRWLDRRPFNRRSNRICWDGLRMSDYPACGGGRRVIRKAEPES